MKLPQIKYKLIKSLLNRGPIRKLITLPFRCLGDVSRSDGKV